ncbi:Spermidine/putrescine transport system permease protein PotB [Chlamydiales bacterium STE3]|nr:Spermidine/putrescine transport system permease protein PotB [Chlamydiales bacterium STE3]
MFRMSSRRIQTLKRTNFWQEFFVSSPSFLWLAFFFVLPTALIFTYAFKSSDLYGGIEPGWTLETIKSLIDKQYLTLIVRTLFLSTITTIICLVLALPLSYFLAQIDTKWRKTLLMLIIIPFWSSFLIRIFAWKSLLHPEGIFKKALVALHLVSPETSLLYNSAAVILVMVYTYLPFAVLPTYAAASKFNFHLIEASMDLGASRTRAFLTIFIPVIRSSIFTAMVMVFIPAIGAYVIPDLVGGIYSEMIGNKIAQRTFSDRDIPLASALSALLTLAVLVPLFVVTFLRRRDKRTKLGWRGKE